MKHLQSVLFIQEFYVCQSEFVRLVYEYLPHRRLFGSLAHLKCIEHF